MERKEIVPGAPVGLLQTTEALSAFTFTLVQMKEVSLCRFTFASRQFVFDFAAILL
jgi:hypothetical protein